MPEPIRLYRFLVLALLVYSTYSVASVPDWVRSAAAQPLPKVDPKTKAIVLLDDSNISVNASGDYVLHHRRVVKILRPEGRTEGDLVVGFNGRDKLNSIHGWSIDAMNREYELKDKDFAEVGASMWEVPTGAQECPKTRGRSATSTP